MTSNPIFAPATADTALQHYDVVVSGGGLVGTAMAIALGGLGLSIALIEAKPSPAPSSVDDHADKRAIALSVASVNILKALAVWPAIAPYATAIKHVHISEKGRFAKARLRAADSHLEAFGYVVALHRLQAVLDAHLKTLSAVTVYRPEQLMALAPLDNGWQCQLRGQTLQASCLLAADGSRSFVREALGIGVRVKKHSHVAVLAPVATAHPMAHTAHERFTAEGPLALLPTGEYSATAVMTTSASQADRWMADSATFMRALSAFAPKKCGQLTLVASPQQHPLIRCWATTAVGPNALLLGNAAHTLHPVAAQGFNLSLRDVAVLTEIIAECGTDAIHWQQCLQEYQMRRQADQQAISRLTESILSLYSLSLLPSRLLRSAGLLALNMPVAKTALIRLGVGMAASGSKRLVYGKAHA